MSDEGLGAMPYPGLSVSTASGATSREPCPFCGAPVAGRTDKVYCSDRCRMASRQRRNPRLSQLALFGPEKTVSDPARPTGEEQRDQILERVGARNQDFLARGLELIARLPAEALVTGESIRGACELACIVPDHYGAWGTLVMQAVRRGLLRKTGRYVPSKAPQKHGHATPVYEIRGGSDG